MDLAGEDDVAMQRRYICGSDLAFVIVGVFICKQKPCILSWVLGTSEIVCLDKQGFPCQSCCVVRLLPDHQQ